MEPPAVGVGVEPIQSVKGYYEYHFDKELDKKPKELPDGSVDYLNVNAISIVQKGDLIAEYFPAKQGRAGHTVTGLEIPVKRVAELPPLRGKGFSRSEDGTKYTADMTGKINEVGGRIVISSVYEVSGDADLSTGNIDFRGDVIVHGAVRDGISIKATGTITVNGVVEGAQLESGGDMVLKKGLIGNSKANIVCKGSLSAKFVEFCYVESQGDINAESFMESEVYCYGKIMVPGKKGKIIGGTTVAIEGVKARFIGNQAGVPTWIRVGADAELKYQIIALQKKIEATQSNLDRVEEGLKVLDQLGTDPGKAEEAKMKKMQLMRVKIRDTSIQSADKIEMERLQSLLVRSQGAIVRVDDTIYAGVNIKIGDKMTVLKSSEHYCEFVEGEEDIKLRRL